MLHDASRRDITFILNEYLDLERITALHEFKHLTPDDWNAIVELAAQQASEVVAPLNAKCDKNGAQYHKDRSVVETSQGYKEAYALYREAGWGKATLSADKDGIGLPECVHIAIAELFSAACPAFIMAPALTRAGANTILTFGSVAQQETYAQKMFSGEWAGTMCLTEPHAGTDVGEIRTKATPVDGHPGRYKLSGTKCFISFGEHDLTENIVHLVLAKTPCAPVGTKGISLFIVPKWKLYSNGIASPVSNDVVCGGIERKMGIHGSPTCTLNFGEKESCEGELVGNEYEGMKYMFLLMNEARLLVGLQSEAIAAASYEAALSYARERVQCKDNRTPKGGPAKSVAIIEHHDVRRMLMTMKAHVEGMRAMLYRTAYYLDLSRNAPDEDERKMYAGWVGLLTPICKAYCSDTAFAVTALGIQIHGGAGYLSDHPAEQFLRDVKINSIYEGTNGIQALDLIGNKLRMKNGKVFMNFARAMWKTVRQLRKHPGLRSEAVKLAHIMRGTGKMLLMLTWKSILRSSLGRGGTILKAFGVDMSGKSELDTTLLHACSILEIFGTLASAFYLLEEAAIASKKLDALYCNANAVSDMAKIACRAANPDAKFYFSKIETAIFFINHLLPRALWRLSAIEHRDLSPMKDVF